MLAFLHLLAGIVRGLVAVPVSVLPRRSWDAFESLPVERVSALSGLATTVAGLLIGARGFLAYGRRASEATVNAAVEFAGRQSRHQLPAGVEVTTWDLQKISVLSVAAFFLFTPLGLFAVYLVFSGVARLASNVVNEPFGDPFLTGLDAAVARWRRRASSARRQRSRGCAEGPAVPDRLFTGDWAGLSGVDFVVVASRRKPDWTAGAVVLTSDKWYTLGEPFDVRLPQGLRTVYPLTEQKVTEVLRRGVPYELPPLSRNRGPGVAR